MRHFQIITVRGGQFVKLKETVEMGLLKKGTNLDMLREPENPYDSNAIAVYTKPTEQHESRKCGFVAREQAAWLASFVDADMPLRLVLIDVGSTFLTCELHIGEEVKVEPMVDDPTPEYLEDLGEPGADDLEDDDRPH